MHTPKFEVDKYAIKENTSDGKYVMEIGVIL